MFTTWLPRLGFISWCRDELLATVCPHSWWASSILHRHSTDCSCSHNTDKLHEGLHGSQLALRDGSGMLIQEAKVASLGILEQGQALTPYTVPEEKQYTTFAKCVVCTLLKLTVWGSHYTERRNATPKCCMHRICQCLKAIAQQGLCGLSRIDTGFVLVRARRPGTAWFNSRLFSD